MGETRFDRSLKTLAALTGRRDAVRGLAAMGTAPLGALGLAPPRPPGRTAITAPPSSASNDGRGNVIGKHPSAAEPERRGRRADRDDRRTGRSRAEHRAGPGRDSPGRREEKEEAGASGASGSARRDRTDGTHGIRRWRRRPDRPNGPCGTDGTPPVQPARPGRPGRLDAPAPPERRGRPARTARHPTLTSRSTQPSRQRLTTSTTRSGHPWRRPFPTPGRRWSSSPRVFPRTGTLRAYELRVHGRQRQRRRRGFPVAGGQRRRNVCECGLPRGRTRVPDAYTFTAKYKRQEGSPSAAAFQNRTIAVIPLP